MRRVICPYLGLEDDPSTSLDFATAGNYCHKAKPIAPVDGDFQNEFCLSANHTTCPIYRMPQPVALPAELAARPAPVVDGRRRLALLGIPVVLAAIVALGLIWNAYGSSLLTNRNNIPDTGPDLTATATSTLGQNVEMGPNGQTLIPSQLPSASQMLITNCPLPENWTPYTVYPTDSLFRLSVIYGVSVKTLQRNNCMGSETVILPGEIIYVPYIPTNTPPAGGPLFSNKPRFTPTPTVRDAAQPNRPRTVTSTPMGLITNTVVNTATRVFPGITQFPTNTLPVVLPTATRQVTSVTPRPTNTLPVVLPTATRPAPNVTPRPTNTVPVILPTATRLAPSSTPPAPTNTAVIIQPTVPAPTNTPELIRKTPKPKPTKRPPDTSTPIPPTDTAVPPPTPLPTDPPPPTTVPTDPILTTDTPIP